MLAQLADISFSYPGTEIFSSTSFQVNPGQRIGLVGPNGAGKSTLLRLLAGELLPDRGQVVQAKGRRVAYMHQSQEFHGQGSLWDTLLLPFSELLAMRAQLEELSHRLQDDSDPAQHEQLLKRYGDLEHEYAQREGYTIEVRARALAYDLGFREEDFSRPVSTLSGGERGRVELAKVLLEQPDLLLLDEPTNHLDTLAVEHLEERLSVFPETRSFVVISHDRYFLQAVCNEIVDVEDGELVRYPGSYEKYLVARKERHERLVATYERQQEEIARTEDFIRKNIAGQKTKQAQSRRKMLEKLERVTRHSDTWDEAGQLGLRFALSEQRGNKEVARAQSVSLGYGNEPPLIRDLDLVIYRGERIGIIGPNGAGKTTLLKALLGRIRPQAGAISVGSEVRIGYFDQKLSDLDEERSLIEEIRSVRGDWNQDVVRGYLGRFRFSGDDAFKIVRGLSGGERNRMQLAKLMLRPFNVLAMDEPTNHLDIPAREALEEALTEYEGTLLVISHDRYFLDRVATKILHLDPETAHIDAHAGNYSDWRRRLSEEAAAKKEAAAREAMKAAEKSQAKQAPKTAAKPVAPPPTEVAKQQRVQDHQARKESAKDRERKERRFAQIESEIARGEDALRALREELAKDHSGNWQRLNQLVADEQSQSEKLEKLLAEWESLGAELASK